MKAKWTWLVYMAGDNNLEGAGVGDLNEMKRVGSNKDLNIVVQFDTEQQQTTRYLVQRNRLKTVQTMDGVNCGDPKVLTDFIKWGKKNYPAERYALVVWNHGGGWEDADVDYDANRAVKIKPLRAARGLSAKRSLFRRTRDTLGGIKLAHNRLIAIDCGARDYLDNQELRKAVEKSHVMIDILGCDACLMNMLEIAYEMRETAKFMVGSEETEPGTGWPYADILAGLVKKPDMATADVAKLIVTKYAAWYKQNGDPQCDRCATQSAFDLAKIETMAQAVDQLADRLREKISTNSAVLAKSLSSALAFEMPDYVDLGSLVGKIAANTSSGNPVAKAAKAVASAVREKDGFVVANGTWGGTVRNATGVSMFFPSRPQSFTVSELLEQYDRLLFTKAHPAWRKLIKAYVNNL